MQVIDNGKILAGSLPDCNINRITLMTDSSSDVYVNDNPHIVEANPVVPPQTPVGESYSVEITFSIENLKSKLEAAQAFTFPITKGKTSSGANIFSEMILNSLVVKFFLMDLKNIEQQEPPLGIDFSTGNGGNGTGEPTFSAVAFLKFFKEKSYAVKIDPHEDINEMTSGKLSILKTFDFGDRKIHYNKIKIDGIPNNITDLYLYYVMYINRARLIETINAAYGLEIDLSSIPLIHGPVLSETILKQGEIARTRVKYFFQDGREFTGVPFVETLQDGTNIYKSVPTPLAVLMGNTPESLITLRSQLAVSDDPTALPVAGLPTSMGGTGMYGDLAVKEGTRVMSRKGHAAKQNAALKDRLTPPKNGTIKGGKY